MESMFTIGQKVVCVNSKHPGGNTYLIEGKVYTVLGIIKRRCCGRVGIDVGIKPKHSESLCLCGATNEQGAVAYKAQERFVPLDFDKQADEEIKQALNESLRVSN